MADCLVFLLSASLIIAAVKLWHESSYHYCQLIFAAIGNAFAVLSDPQKRKRYDEYGSSDDTELRRRSRPNGYEYDFSRGFEGTRHFPCL